MVLPELPDMPAITNLGNARKSSMAGLI